MADYKNPYAARSQPRQALQRPWKRQGLRHSRSVNIALHFGPIVFISNFAQEIANRTLALLDFARYEALFKSNAMKKPVIAHDSIIEINTQYHVAH